MWKLCVNISFQISWVNTCECEYPIRLYANTMFGFVRNYQTVFQSGCTIYISTNNECKFFLLAPHPYQFWVFLVLGFNITSSCEVAYYCFLNCIKITCIKYLFTSLIAICIYPLVSCMFIFMPIFIVFCLFVLLLLNFKFSCILWICLASDVFLKYFLQVNGLSF